MHVYHIKNMMNVHCFTIPSAWCMYPSGSGPFIDELR